MEEIIIYLSIILIASTVQTSTGFGFAVLATPFLLFLFEPREAIQINLILSIVISLALIKTVSKDIDFGILKRFILGSCAGLPLGLLLFIWLDVHMLKLVISITILALTIMLFLKLRLKQTRSRDVVIGGLSGALTTSLGMPGPPILLYFSGTETTKETIRATTVIFFLCISILSIIMQVMFVGITRTTLVSTGFALPIVLLGLYIGQLLFTRINQHTFRLFTYIILLFSGLYLFVESWGISYAEVWEAFLNLR